MKQVTGHPDFLNAPRHNQNAGSLASVFAFLDFETKKRPPYTWCYRVIPDGTRIEMQRKRNGKRVLRISRGAPLNSAAERDRWNQRVCDMLLGFGQGTILWHQLIDRVVGTASEFHEEEPGQRCECGALIEPGLIGVDACLECATKRKRWPAESRA